MQQRTIGGASPRAGRPRWGYLSVCLGALVLLGGAFSRAAEADSDLDYAVKTLQEARVGTDGPALLKFFRDRTLSVAARAKLSELVRALGSDEFPVRQKAYKELQAAGRAAVPFLTEAKKSPDPEIARSAERLLKQIESGTDASVVVAAARVLAARKPDGAAKVLLEYLPLADDEILQDAILKALVVAGIKDGKVEPAVIAAAGDKRPECRAAAALVLSKAGADQRPAVRKLLKDSDVRVRFQASAGLVRSGDKAGVDTLIALVGEAPPELAGQCEDLLCRIAGDKAPPPVDLSDGPGRRRYRTAWEDWWKANSGGIELAKIDLEKADRGLNVLCEYDGGRDGQGRVWECGADGKARWEVSTGLGGPLDAHALPNGHILIAEYNAHRVTERDRQGKVLWEKKLTTSVLSCQRLPNGNTLIASMSEILEVTRDGKVVLSYARPSTYYATKLRNGHILTTNATQVVELDATGKQVRAITLNGINWGTVQKLANGRYLAALYGGQKVVEVDATGKVFWQCNLQSPTMAIRLRNGNTLVSSAEGRLIAEYDRAGKEVWKKMGAGRVWRVRRH